MADKKGFTRKINSHIPQKPEDILSNLMEVNPSQRIPSAKRVNKHRWVHNRHIVILCG
ncbi:MAG: hypothetical protein OZ917_09590 [Candidatus Brocadiaceae bacterium]|nr:hypothetical protein [Candidatus Brocadiaceae bacterium]